MAARARQNTLQKWEVAIIKAMLTTGEYTNQKILAYFTRPARSINQARIVEIKKDKKFKTIPPASPDDLANFLKTWPQIDWNTGLHLVSDELLLKGREAMLFAVQAYNNPRAVFRSEVFIVTAMIAWTYLMHAYLKSKGIDIRYTENRDGKKAFVTTKHGAFKNWELEKCLGHPNCPLDKATKNNLLFIVEIRHEIEHQMTRRIDDALSAKFQACCLNFNRVIKELFGAHLALDQELTTALQFVGFNLDQRKILAKESDLPPNLLAAQKAFEDNLSQEEFNDSHYAFRTVFIQKSVSNKGAADLVVQFVRPDSEEAREVNRVLLKEVEKAKYKPMQIVKLVQKAGYPRFQLLNHTELWKKHNAKEPRKQFGIQLSDGQWYWYESWFEFVKKHCAENKVRYQRAAAVAVSDA